MKYARMRPLGFPLTFIQWLADKASILATPRKLRMLDKGWQTQEKVEDLTSEVRFCGVLEFDWAVNINGEDITLRQVLMMTRTLNNWTIPLFLQINTSLN